VVLTDASQVTVDWVDRVLHEAGVTPAGAVTAVDVDPGLQRVCSRIARIGVRYRHTATDRAPARLLLKLCHDENESFGRSEVDFYRRDYAGAVDAPMPRCFDAAYAEHPRRYHLLLEDLSATHVNADGVDPDAYFCRALAQSLAALHSHRWGEHRLRELGCAPAGRQEIDAYVEHVAKGLDPMLALAGRDMASQRVRELRALFEDLADRFARRARDPRGFALVHGDLNPGNLLVPKSRSGPVLLIDRQPFDWSLTRWLAVSDLVLAMVPWWETNTRRRLEPCVLEHYGEALRARGVTDYPMSLLRADYRLCLAMAVAVPMAWCIREDTRTRMQWLWSMQLQRALAACEESP
jgi:hypothetical protein